MSQNFFNQKSRRSLLKNFVDSGALLSRGLVLSSVCICVSDFFLLEYFAKWEKGTKTRYIVKKSRKRSIT